MFQHDDPGWGWGGDDGEYYDPSQVSIIPGGILRLTAVRLSNPVPIWSVWKNGYRYCNYKSGMIQLRRDVSGPPFEGCNGYMGFTYGMFEVRMKIPKGATFPAFWLIGPTQFNIYEGKFNSRKYGVGFDNEWVTDPVTGQHPGRSQWMNKLNWDDLADNFHTYTGVWTPNKITFFFDGREICTFTGDVVESLQNYGGWCQANSIIVSMQMPGWSNVSTCNLDIDYIKVYKPISNDYSVSYKSSNENMHHDVFANITPTPTTVSSYANSIAINPNNGNEVFYRGSNNYIFSAYRTGNSWQVKRLEFNDGGGPSLAAGDIRYLPIHDKILYVGSNQRINVFGRSNIEPCGFYHWYLRNDWWIGDYDKVYPQAGALQTAPNGDIFFKGIDSKMHRYYFAGGVWNHQIFNHPNTASYIDGDIVIDPNTLNVFYRGADNRLQTFWKDGAGNYNHAWVDANWNTTAYTIKNLPGSMVYVPALNGILYIGADNKIQLYNWNTTWYHSWIPYSYGNPNLGYVNGDYAKSSIEWDNSLQRIYYAGYDGRIQTFGKSGSSWWHSWVNDYWNTDEYSSFNSGQNYYYSASLKLGSDGSNPGIFYTRKDSHLAYFKYEPCEVLNPTNGGWRNLNKPLNENNTNIDTNQFGIEIFPNPVHDWLTIREVNLTNNLKTVRIYDIAGNLMININSEEQIFKINVRNLRAGIYIIEINDGRNITHQKIIKQ